MDNVHKFVKQSYDRLLLENSLKYDLVCFCLNENNEVENKFDIVFFNQHENHNKSIMFESKDYDSFNKRSTEFSFSFSQFPSYVKKVYIYAVNLNGTIDSDFFSCFKGFVSNLNQPFTYDAFHTKLVGSVRIASIYQNHQGDWVVDTSLKENKYDLLGLTDIHKVKVYKEDRDNHRETELESVMKEAGLSHFIDRKADFYKEINRNIPLENGQSYSTEEIINDKNKFSLVLDLSVSMESNYLNSVHQKVLEVLSFISFLTEDELSVDLWVYAENCVNIGRLSSGHIQNFFKDVEAKKDKYDYSLFPNLGIGNNTDKMIKSVLDSISDNEGNALIIHLTDSDGIPNPTSENRPFLNMPGNVFWQTLSVTDTQLTQNRSSYLSVESISLDDIDNSILICKKMITGWKEALTEKALNRG